MVIRLQNAAIVPQQIFQGHYAPIQYLRRNIPHWFLLLQSWLQIFKQNICQIRHKITLIGPFDEAGQPGKMMSKKSQTEIVWYICLERSGFGDQTSKNCIDTLFCTVQLLPLFLLSAAPLGNVVNLAIASTVLMRATQCEKISITRLTLWPLSSSRSAAARWGREEKPVREKVGVRGALQSTQC